MSSPNSRHTDARPDHRAPHGVLLIDKPAGITSHDVVDRIRKLYRTRAVGHCGTLDPAATGLLVVLLGKTTKAASLFSDADKTYAADIRFGARSSTGDTEGVITETVNATAIERKRLEEILHAFAGTITQPIPAYAAVRDDGQRRHERARRGEAVAERHRTVTISRISLAAFDWPVATIKVTCSAGTYVRSLAEQIGDALGCGAYLTGLRREQSGNCSVAEAWTLDELAERVETGKQLPQPGPIAGRLGLATLTLTAAGCTQVGHGRIPTEDTLVHASDDIHPGDVVLLRNEDGTEIAIAEATGEMTLSGSETTALPIRYRRVLVKS